MNGQTKEAKTVEAKLSAAVMIAAMEVVTVAKDVVESNGQCSEELEELDAAIGYFEMMAQQWKDFLSGNLTVEDIDPKWEPWL